MSRQSATLLRRAPLLATVAIAAALACASIAQAAGSAIVNQRTEGGGYTSTSTVNGLLGGVVSAGRVTVIIPPGAIAGVTQVTVTQPDSARLVAEVHLADPSLNRFTVPVLLSFRAGGLLSANLLSRSEVQWWDPAAGKWVSVPGTVVNLGLLSIQAPLWHFSRYQVGGRAGW